MHRILSLAALCSALFSTAQQALWLSSTPLPTTGNNVRYQQMLAANGTGLAVGRTTLARFSYGQKQYGDVAVSGVDPSTGDIAWSSALGDSALIECAAMDDAGRTFVAGTFIGALDGPNGLSWPNSSNDLWNEDIFLAAFDVDGSLLWFRDLSVDHPQATSIAALAIDHSGNLWYALSSYDLAEVFRVDEVGNDVGSRQVSGIRAIGTISFDPWGGMYMTGAADESGLVFGGQSFTTTLPGLQYLMFVLRFTPNGDAGFACFAYDITFQRPTVVADASGHAYVAGSLLDSTSWGDVVYPSPEWGTRFFLVRVDSLGVFDNGLSSEQVGGGISGDMQRADGPTLAVDEANTAYVLGIVRGTIDIGGIQLGGGTPTERRLCLAAVAPTGDVLWGISSAVGGLPDAMHLVAGAQGRVHFAAQINSAFELSPLLTNPQNERASLIGSVGPLSTGAMDPSLDGSIVVWPVPAADAIFFTSNAPLLRAELYDGVGHLRRSEWFDSSTARFDLEPLPSGVYVLRTSDGRAVRFVKQ